MNNTPIALACRAERPPSMQGDWTDEQWQRCQPFDDFFYAATNLRDENSPICRACYDDDWLYIGIERSLDAACDSTFTGWGPTARDNGLSIIVDPDIDGGRCVELVVNAAGGRFHYDHGENEITVATRPWFVDWQAHVMRTDAGFRAVVCIPVPKRSGDTWALQIVAQRPERQRASAWSPLSSWYESGYWFTAEQGRIVFSSGVERVRQHLESREPSSPLKPTPKQSFRLSTTVDPTDDMLYDAWDEKSLSSFMAELKSWGVDRVYWIDYGPANEGLMCDGFSDYWPSSRDNYHKTFANLGGDLLKPAVDAAHEQGLEFWSIIKSLDMGYDWLAPKGLPSKADRIGGRINDVANTLVQRPELNMKRIAGDVAYIPGQTRIGEIHLVHETDEPTNVRAQDLQLWVSSDNFHYERYDGPIDVVEQAERRPVRVYDPRGVRSISQQQMQRVIRLCNLNIGERYVVVECPVNGVAGSFRNRAFGLVEVYDQDGQLQPIIFGGGDRNPPRDLRYNLDTGESELVSQPTSDFREHGIVFPGLPTSQRWSLCGHIALDNERGRIAFALGPDEILIGAPEPANPLVQDWWLSWTQRAIDCGVDGQEFRLRHHMAGNQQWEAYGYDDLICEEHQGRTGIDPRTGPIDYAAIEAIRGEAWMRYVATASAMLRDAGKKSSHELLWYMFMPPTQRQRFHIHFDWQKIVQGKLVDEISLKGISPFTWLGRRAMAEAQTHDLPVRVELHQRATYHQGAPRAGLARMIEDIRKMGAAGYNIYETAGTVAPDGKGGYRDVLTGERAFWRAMAAYYREDSSTELPQLVSEGALAPTCPY